MQDPQGEFLVTSCIFFLVLIVKGSGRGSLQPRQMKRNWVMTGAIGLLFIAVAAPAEAGRRKRSEVPPPVIIDRTVFTPVVSGL